MMTDPTSASAPAGWYSAGVDGQERYWDGAAWTDHVRPAKLAPVSDHSPSLSPTTHQDATEPISGHTYEGTAPTEVSQPATTSVPSAPADTKGSGTRWYKRKAIVIPIAVLAGILLVSGVGSAIGGNRSDDAPAPEAIPTQAEPEPAAAVATTVPETTGLSAKEAQALIENAGLKVEFSAEEGVVLDRDNWTVLSTVPAAGANAEEGDTIVVNVEKILSEAEKAAAEAEKAAEEAEKALAEMSVAQQSAIRSAKSYLEFTGFSRAGLTQQLTSEYGEGYEPADAEAAIAYLESTGAVDWNVEAVQSAESYLEMSGFSRQGLFDQLTSSYGEGFTPEQANYALDQVGL